MNPKSIDPLLDQLKDLNGNCRKVVMAACAFGLIITIVICGSVTGHLIDQFAEKRYNSIQRSLDSALRKTYDQSFTNTSYSDRALNAYLASVTMLTMTTDNFPSEGELLTRNSPPIVVTKQERETLLTGFSGLRNYKSNVDVIIRDNQTSANSPSKSYQQLSPADRQILTDILFFEDTSAFARMSQIHDIIAKYSKGIEAALNASTKNNIKDTPTLLEWKNLYSQGFADSIKKTPFMTIVDRRSYLSDAQIDLLRNELGYAQDPSSDPRHLSYADLTTASNAAVASAAAWNSQAVTIPILGLTVPIDGLNRIAPITLLAFVLCLAIILARYRVIVSRLSKGGVPSEILGIYISDFPLVTTRGLAGQLLFTLLVSVAPIIAAISPIYIAKTSGLIYQVGHTDVFASPLDVTMWIATVCLLVAVFKLKRDAQRMADEYDIRNCMLKVCRTECEGCPVRMIEPIDASEVSNGSPVHV